MPLQFPDFNRISFQEANPWLSGAQAGQQLIKMPFDLQSTMIANQLKQLEAQKAQQLMPFVTPMAEQELQKSQLENQYYAPNIQSEINLRKAQGGYYGQEANKIGYELAHPGLLGGEETKTIEALKAMGYNISPNQGTSPNPINIQSPKQTQDSISPPSLSDLDQTNTMPFNTGNSMVDSILNRKFSESAYKQKMTQGFNYVHAPVDAKNYMIAQLAGAGIDPSEGVNLLTSGYSVPQILKSRGFDPSNAPEPDFLPTRGNIEKLKQRQAALQEVNSLGDFIRKGLGKYAANNVLGFSVPQIKDALLGMNDEQQSDFLAARGLAPELSNVRLMLAQARTGKYAMQSMLDKSMTNANAFRSLVSQKVWNDAQRKMDEQLVAAFNKSEKAYSVGRNKSINSGKNKSESVTKWVRKNGQLVREE